jgi:GNAT superfamily N-acetyltransferase
METQAGDRMSTMNTDEIKIIPLEESHLVEATRICAEAFLNEPGAVATIGKTPEKRLPLLREHFGAQAKLSLAGGVSRCALMNGKIVGAMIISPPGNAGVSGLDMLKLVLRVVFKTSPAILWRAIKSSAEDEKHRPKEPNNFLEIIAVDPKRQGQGIGKAMLSHLTGMSDSEGILTYLSTTDPRTLPLYRRHGFKVISETNELGIPNYHLVRKRKPMKGGSA